MRFQNYNKCEDINFTYATVLWREVACILKLFHSGRIFGVNEHTAESMCCVLSVCSCLTSAALLPLWMQLIIRYVVWSPAYNLTWKHYELCMWEISGFLSDVVEAFALVGCYASVRDVTSFQPTSHNILEERMPRRRMRLFSQYSAQYTLVWVTAMWQLTPTCLGETWSSPFIFEGNYRTLRRSFIFWMLQFKK